MPPKSSTKKKSTKAPRPLVTSLTPLSPLIFISHDHRDSSLAAHFSDLLSDVSAGTLKSFRSSDRKGRAGIDYGAEWYGEIMTKISEASDVVALLTKHSIDRPWILFEAGVAKGRVDRPVFGVTFGISIDQAVKGPFAQFQNSQDDEESLTKLVMQLLRRIPNAEPREEAVRKHIETFKTAIAKNKSSSEQERNPVQSEAADAAKLFEEIKLLFREFSSNLNGQIAHAIDSDRIPRRLNRHVIKDLIGETHENPATTLLMISSIFRDDVPWIYEAGLELHRALVARNTLRVSRAAQQMQEMLRLSLMTDVGSYLTKSSDTRYALHFLEDFLPHLLQGIITRNPLSSKERVNNLRLHPIRTKDKSGTKSDL